ncbi:transposase [Moraxella osloensis]|nr:transposase [Moraxella osloensis]UAY37716.1 transposase [Moraxella osloensis]
MTKVRKTYTLALKLEMIKLIEEQGQKPSDVTTQYEIAESTLENWLTCYRREKRGNPISKGNALIEEQREIQRLKKEVAKLKLERDILNEEG